MHYSIIVPIFNEEKKLNKLLKELRPFSIENEIIIINDGSTDNSVHILENCSFVKIINLTTNSGKGIAIRTGLLSAVHKKIIIYDGDLELDTSGLKKLMHLRKDVNCNYIIGVRFEKINIRESLWSLGIFTITKLYNFLNKTKFIDPLCCAKAFYKNDISLDNLKSKGFDVDIELLTLLYYKNKNYESVLIPYKRRSINSGKKLRVTDGLVILYRVLILYLLNNLFKTKKNIYSNPTT